jgi:hypothetical protein
MKIELSLLIIALCTLTQTLSLIYQIYIIGPERERKWREENEGKNNKVA